MFHVIYQSGNNRKCANFMNKYYRIVGNALKKKKSFEFPQCQYRSYALVDHYRFQTCYEFGTVKIFFKHCFCQPL